MKLTSLDIHHKEFRHSLRGYAEDEVDKFLDEVADEFERLLKENIDLSEQLQAVTARIKEFEIKESAVNNAIIAAQTAAEDMRNKAGVEADTVVRDAEIKAKEIIHNALSRKQQVAAELVRIKQAEEEFRARFKGLLEQHQRSITEVALPDDVEVLLGETDEGVEADVVVRAPERAPEPAAAPVFSASELSFDLAEPPAPEPEPVQVAPEPVAAAPKPAPAPEPVAPVPAPVPVSEPAPVPAPEAEAAPEPDPMVTSIIEQFTQAMPPAQDAEEDAGPTYVQSVTFGEVEAPDIPGDVQLIDPAEFNLPDLRTLGEREDDIDIEEID